MQNLKTAFAQSPAVWLSLINCLWLFIRAITHQLKLASTEPSLLELTLVALVGMGAAVAALLRDKEQAWYISLVTMTLNAAAWLYAVSQLDWDYLYNS